MPSVGGEGGGEGGRQSRDVLCSLSTSSRSRARHGWRFACIINSFNEMLLGMHWTLWCMDLIDFALIDFCLMWICLESNQWLGFG